MAAKSLTKSPKCLLQKKKRKTVKNKDEKKVPTPPEVKPIPKPDERIVYWVYEIRDGKRQHGQQFRRLFKQPANKRVGRVFREWERFYPGIEFEYLLFFYLILIRF